MEAEKRRLEDKTTRTATSNEVEGLRRSAMYVFAAKFLQ